MTKKITVYSTPGCPYCKLAKEFLKDKQVDFKDIDVSEDQNAAQQMVEKSGQMGVPVLIIGEEVIVGFDKPKIEHALNL